MTITGYQFDGYDGSDESFEKLAGSAMPDLTVEWDVVVHRSAVTSVPGDATHEGKLKAASALAASLTGLAGEGSVIRGTVRYQSGDGTFGGSIA